MKQVFWNLWYQDYLHTLTVVRYHNYKNNVPIFQWQIYPDEDQVVRAVLIKKDQQQEVALLYKFRWNKENKDLLTIYKLEQNISKLGLSLFKFVYLSVTKS